MRQAPVLPPAALTWLNTNPMGNHYQNGVPQRITHVDEPGKTKRFVIRGAIIWLGVLALYLAMWEWVLPLMIESMSNWILVPLFIIYSQLLLATFSIPIILMFAILLKLMEKGVSRVLRDK